jgi:hypothetical protein
MLDASYKMAYSTSDKRMRITTSPYNVPSADVTPDQPIFSLDTIFKSLYFDVFLSGRILYTRQLDLIFKACLKVLSGQIGSA